MIKLNTLQLLALLTGFVLILIIVIIFVFIAPSVKKIETPPPQISTSSLEKPQTFGTGSIYPYFYNSDYQSLNTSSFVFSSSSFLTTSSTSSEIKAEQKPKITKEEILKLKMENFPLQKFYGPTDSKETKTKIFMNQVFLYQKGRLNIEDITGYYNEATIEAVKKFQTYLNLAPTGQFDEATALLGSAFYNALPNEGNFSDERPILSFDKEDSPYFYFYGTGLVPLKLNSNLLSPSFFITKIVNEKLFNAGGGSYSNKGHYIIILNNTSQRQSCSLYDLDKNNALITNYAPLPNSLNLIQIKNEAGAIYQKQNSLLVCGKKRIEIHLNP